jgi:3'-phosphoadenosine 5'-phosphosulfate sulfotransferase (PAPS reductase)/FAD synthetase
VAAKLARQSAPGEFVVAYCDTGSEHPDNERFLRDCEEWIGQPIIRLKSERYDDIWDVFERTGWLVGPGGARCTSELKKRVRNDFMRVSDLQVFGFDRSEARRVERFKANNPEVRLLTPLLDRNLSKSDCLAMLQNAGIELPEMYKLGYDHNNCVGCVKGQKGYWNKIRVDFPEVFERMAKLERKLNVAICKTEPKDPVTGKRKRLRVFLDELDPNDGRGVKEPTIACSLWCSEAESELG